MLEQVNEIAGTDSNILVFTNMTGIGNMEVNVFQRGCDVVVQKSLQEGFGLVVSEALWKGKSVVAGDTAGIRLQIPSAYQQFLVDTVEGCAQKIAALLGDAATREAFGEAGRCHVRQRFLLPRLALDDLRLSSESPALRDPVSGAEICFPPSACQFAGMEPARRGKEGDAPRTWPLCSTGTAA